MQKYQRPEISMTVSLRQFPPDVSGPGPDAAQAPACGRHLRGEAELGGVPARPLQTRPFQQHVPKLNNRKYYSLTIDYRHIVDVISNVVFNLLLANQIFSTYSFGPLF
jgi:hypothetical protein